MGTFISCHSPVRLVRQFIILLLMVAAGILQAQNIVKTEYFLNSDPGFGLGTDVPVIPAPNVTNLQFSVGLGSVPEGFHTLWVRSKDDAGRWSLARVAGFYKSALPPGSLPLITRAEYYLDSDPGFGSGNPVPVTPASNIPSLPFTIDLGTVSPGFHTLYVRAGDDQGRWALSQVKGFFKLSPAPAALGDVTRLEYFLDTDPGFGSGTALAVGPSPNLSNLQFLIDLTPVPVGFHMLYTRARDSQGRWSLCQTSSFFKLSPAPGALPNLTRVEYFLDSDPGFGSGTSVPVTPSSLLDNFVFNVDLTSVQAGFHTLYVRSGDANGRYSHCETHSFFKTALPPATLSNITSAEYFIGADPGFGNGTPIPITPATAIENLPFIVDLAGVPVGFHILNVRTRDASGKWSLAQTRSFFKAPVPAPLPDVTQVEYFFDSEPGQGNGTSVPVAAAPNINNLSFVVDLGTQTPGPHTLWIRSKDGTGKWSQPVWYTYTQTNLPVSVSISASAGQVCQGTPVTFTASPVNGGTSPGYQWKVNGINAGSNSATFTYAPVNNDVVTCVLTSSLSNVNGNPATSNPVVMSVTSLTATVQGTSSVCAASGNHTYMTEPGMTNYTWTLSGGGGIVSGQGTASVQVNWLSAGSHTVAVTYSDGAGCTTLSPGTLPVTVSSVPSPAGAISGPNQLCSGTFGVIYSVDPVPGAVTYLWTVPSQAVLVSGAGTRTIVVDFPTLTSGGLVTVKGVNACGNGPVSPWFEVTVSPPVTGHDTIRNVFVIPGGFYCDVAQTLTVAGGGTSFVVQSGGTTELLASESIRLLPGVNVHPGGSFHALITTRCKPCTIHFKETEDPVPGPGIAAGELPREPILSSEDVTVYPNPTDGEVTLVYSGGYSTDGISMELTDAIGTVLARPRFTEAKKCVVSMEAYPAGLYLVRLITPGGSVVKKILRR